MRVMRISNHTIALSSVSDLIETKYKPEPIDLSKYHRIGKQLISKAAETKKVVSQPYSMSKLLSLLDTDEYHSGCIDALSMATVMQLECKNSQVKAWMETAEFPACEDQTTILAEMIKFYLASGNGFLIKMRNAQGQWMGLERMLPSEVQILGELAEKPGKTDSKINKLKTRNYSIPGKRTSTVELNIAGLSTKQKNFLESNLFMGKDTTIVVASKDLDRAVIFTGLRWTVDWSGEADGLFNVVISTEFSGVTSNKIFLLKDIPAGA